MIICESALIGIIFMLGIYTSVTDIRYGIVSNKSIILALAAGTLVNIFYYLRYEETFVKLYFVNLTGMIILSVLLYGFHFWAAHGTCSGNLSFCYDLSSGIYLCSVRISHISVRTKKTLPG